MTDQKPEIPYLAICPWDVERWESSGAYLGMSLAAQGAYRNLCDKAWKRQPTCLLPDNDRLLWKLAGAGSLEEWLVLKSDVFASGAWEWTPNGWLNEVVLETYKTALSKHEAAVRSGRIAGRASARARRAMAQAVITQRQRTAVERTSNERSTTVNPPSPSPSPSPKTTNEIERAADPLMNREKWKAEWYELIPFVAQRADLDPTEVAKKVTEWNGGSYVLFDSIPDKRLAHSMAALRKWARTLRGEKEPEMPKPEHPPPSPPRSVGGRTLEAVKEFGQRRGLNVGSGGTGDQIRGGTGEAVRGLPPGGGRADPGDLRGGDGGSG